MKNLFDRKTVGKDAIAGLTLGIESIPDAMASALLAAVSPIHGLYAVMLATPVGAVFASSIYMSVQTTSAMSLVVADATAVHTHADPTAALFMLSILTGAIMLTMGILKLGFVLRFVSNAVMTGFINGIAILIILGQLGDLVGYAPEGSNKVTQTLDLVRNITQIDPRTVAIGLVAIVLIVVLTNTRLKAMGIVVALAAASALVAVLGWDSVALVADISEIPRSLPRPVLPAFTAIPDLLIPAAALAFVGLVQGAGVSQNYVNPDGQYPDASGDFVGQGAGNIAAGLFQGMPVGGSLSATALVQSSGARTRFANIFAGLTIVVALLVFGDAISALAMPALAGLLIVVGFQTFKPDDILVVWKTGMVQQVVMVATFAATLVMPLQYAVLVGIALSTVLFVVSESNALTLKAWAFEPGETLPVEQDPPSLVQRNQVIPLRPYGSLFYAAAQAFEEQLPEVTDETSRAAVILMLRGHNELGSTFVEVIERYSGMLREHDSRLILTEVRPSVYEELAGTGFLDVLGRENVFIRTKRVAESTMAALEEANAWVKSADDDRAG